jgi:hypothetical protein
VLAPKTPSGRDAPLPNRRLQPPNSQGAEYQLGTPPSHHRYARNATVQGYVCVALARTSLGCRLYWAVYVLPVSWVTRPYLIAIEPFRRFLLYPAMLRRIRDAWRAAYSGNGK